MECEELASSLLPASPTEHATPPRRPRQNLQAVDFDYFLGNDNDTDESDNEESVVLPGISRVCWGVMETPLDLDAAEEPEPTTDIASAGDCTRRCPFDCDGPALELV